MPRWHSGPATGSAPGVGFEGARRSVSRRADHARPGRDRAAIMTSNWTMPGLIAPAVRRRAAWQRHARHARSDPACDSVIGAVVPPGIRQRRRKPCNPGLSRVVRRPGKGAACVNRGVDAGLSRREDNLQQPLRPPLNGRSDRDRSRLLPAIRARRARCGRSRHTASRNADRDSFPSSARPRARPRSP